MAFHPEKVTKKRCFARLIAVTATILLIIVAAEIFARVGLGLGDPPLMMADPEIEYLAQPSKTYTRFGHRIHYNRWSMRSDDFAANKSSDNEFRVLVLGDSVVNGGAQTDQNNLATEIAKRELAAGLNRPVIVGNISAGSWGPQNLLAYLKRFGTFDADAIVLVISSHDVDDAPTFTPFGSDVAQRTPLLALQEAAMTYLPRYLPTWLGGLKPTPQRDDATQQADEIATLKALRDLLDVCKQSGARVIVLQHWEEGELKSGPQRGHDVIAQVVDEAGVSRIDLDAAFRASIEKGVNPYRDYIHPNDAGQGVLADVILKTVDALKSQMNEDERE